jgi:hypothetical protein
MDEEQVKRRLLAVARKLVHDTFSLTEDFDNLDAFEDLLAGSFGGHARFVVTDLEVWEGESGMRAHLQGTDCYTVTYFRMSDRRTVLEAHFDLDCELDEYAKADLQALSVGLHGYLLPDDASARTVQRQADGTLRVVDRLRGIARQRHLTLFPDGRVVAHDGPSS